MRSVRPGDFFPAEGVPAAFIELMPEEKSNLMQGNKNRIRFSGTVGISSMKDERKSHGR